MFEVADLELVLLQLFMLDELPQASLQPRHQILIMMELRQAPLSLRLHKDLKELFSGILLRISEHSLPKFLAVTLDQIA